jgi:hypothetical protein
MELEVQMNKLLLVILLIACAGTASARGANRDFLARKEQSLERTAEIHNGPVDPERERCGGIAIVRQDGQTVYCQ